MLGCVIAYRGVVILITLHITPIIRIFTPPFCSLFAFERSSEILFALFLLLSFAQKRKREEKKRGVIKIKTPRY